MISFDTFVPQDNIPIYLQIVAFIKRGIAAGTIPDGAEMPSRRMLSALLGVNPNTVQKSYAMLEEQGLIHSRSGAKSSVAADGATIRALRSELLEERLNSVIREMKELGLTLSEAQEALTTHWEVQP